ncbi:YczE/YyaS/YitT family protein [Niallia sp. Krafla_26]|uniref:YczE/YyaS/YitT family protein n=1 Tax=Niallia sp. Krafla_26 TaxID=3064703 RepID=UPI003D185B43
MGKKLLFYIIGIAIACMGVTFIIKSQAGAGPQDVVLLVLAEKIGFTFGTWVILSQGVFLLVSAWILQKRPQIESVMTMIIWGVFVDFWGEFIFRDLTGWLHTPASEWTCFLIGVLLIGMGVGIYLTANLPAMPYDGLMIGLCEKFGINLMMSRTILEVIFIIIGVIIGGQIGVGTIVLVICIGTIIQFFNGLAHKIYTFSFR